jgi:hypothetical protein
MISGKKYFTICLAFIASAFGCKTKQEPITSAAAPASEVVPVDINKEGFEFLDRINGLWIGTNHVLSWEFDWFAFDFRPISSSHVFNIFEGGTMGNLLNSFFVTDYKGTRTIMARNGGVLNGIYRTSYFVLDSIKKEGNKTTYRLVDAIGGAKTMYMELTFNGNDDLTFEAFTSRLGESPTPRKHMAFKGKRQSKSLANTIGAQYNFPQNTPAWDFSQGFRTDYLYVIDGEPAAKSSTFLAQGQSNDVYKLATLSGDPFTIKDHVNMGAVDVKISRNSAIKDMDLFAYLSTDSLTDSNGYMVTDKFESVVLFPTLNGGENEFEFTYIHPGEYFVTIIADKNKNGYPSEGDITHVSKRIEVKPGKSTQVGIKNINVQN